MKLPTIGVLSTFLWTALAQSGNLTVPGATLYYETYGSGPLILFISGGNGAADVWRNVTTYLESEYTVAIYDRRGFSRSHLSALEPQDYSVRLETDVSDAAALINHLSPTTKASLVLGTSSGAIVALKFLTTYPNLTSTLASHEVPAMKILDDAATLEAAQRGIYATYRAQGIPPAMAEFGALYKAGPLYTLALQLSMDTSRGPYIGNNDQYWMEREFLPYPLQDFNVTDFAPYKGLLMLANGDQTDPTAPQYRANGKIADTLGLNVTLFPGSHVGYQTNPKEWAGTLLAALAARQ